MQSYQEIRTAAVEALAQGDHESAYRTFRSAIEFGFGTLDGSEAQFVDAFGLFAQISEHFANDEFVAMVRRVSDEPNDVQALYDLGYVLYEEGLSRVGATVLTRADELAPGQPVIISELVSSLEQCNLCSVAVDVLQRYRELASSNFMLSYLLAFNALMSGQLALTREMYASLPELSDGSEDHQVMTARIGRYLNRVDRVSHITPLSDSDLRGWHYVITGGILTYLSPFGYPDPMNGRFAFLQDSLETVRHGIELLRDVIAQTNVQVDRVIGLEDRSSQIVATAVATALDMPLEPWAAGAETSQALLVAYDLSAMDLSPYEPLRQRRAGQLLYSHALCWVQSCPLAPDVVMFLHQYNTAPWEPQMQANPDGEGPRYSDPDDRPPATIAKEILETTGHPSEGGDASVPPLTNKFLKAVDPFPEAEGQREIVWETSPVPSSRFA